MSLFRKANPLDVLAGTILVVLAIIISGVIAYTNWVGISVNLHTANPRDQIGPYETLTLTFSQAVRPDDVENQLQLQPSISGKLEWQNDHILRFTPAKPYLGTISVHLVPGKIGVNGDWMRKDSSWTLTVRRSSIIYINYAAPQNELMVIPAEGGSPRQLTFTGGKVVDFGASPSGDTVGYWAANNQKGSELWLVNRDGQNPRRLLDCGTNICSTLIWSPDGKTIAYNRQLPSLSPNAPYGLPRPWIINVETAENRPVFSDEQEIGLGALWSPDGDWLASYDLKTAQIRIKNLKTDKEVLLPSNSGTLGSWSPDGKFLIYPDYTQMANPILSEITVLQNSVSLVNFDTGAANTLLDKDSDSVDYKYGNLVWSPGGDQIAMSMRNVQHQGPRLWVVQSNKLEEPIMTATPGYSYDFYQWDPWGIALLIQQVDLSKANGPEVAVWYPVQGYKIVGKNAIFPHWLP